MKICQVTDHLPKYHEVWGGAEQICYRLIKLLTKERQEVNVLSIKPVKTPKENFKFFTVRTLENYLIPIARKYSAKVKTIFFPFDPISCISFYKILKKLKPDVLHFHNFKILSLSLLYIAKILKIPTLLTIYDYWHFCPKETLFDSKGEVCKKFQGTNCIGCYRFKRIRYLQNFFLPFRKRIFDFLLKKVDAFLVLSQSSSGILQRYGIDKRKIYLIHQPFSFPNKKVEEPEIEKYSILFAGWLQYRKGLHVIIEALPQILKILPEARLYVLGLEGDEEYKKRLQELVSKPGLREHILFLGRLSREEFLKHFKKANVVVVPEQWENVSAALITEAMAYAKPIVASRIGAFPEFIKDGESGFLANPKKPKAFAKGIIWVLTHEKEALHMGRNARKYALSLFSEKIVSEKILILYKSLARK